MIVIPERCRLPAIRITIGHRISWSEPLLRQPVAFRSSASTVKMGYGSDLRGRRHRTVDARIYLEDMLLRQVVLPLDYDRSALQSLDSWTGILPLISPQPRGRKLRMHLPFEFQHANAILNPVAVRDLRHQLPWDRKWIYISFQ